MVQIIKINLKKNKKKLENKDKYQFNQLLNKNNKAKKIMEKDYYLEANISKKLQLGKMLSGSLPKGVPMMLQPFFDFASYTNL